MDDKPNNSLPDIMPNESAEDYLIRVLYAGLRIPKRFLMPCNNTDDADGTKK